jgi:hypothetical protein
MTLDELKERIESSPDHHITIRLSPREWKELSTEAMRYSVDLHDLPLGHTMFFNYMRKVVQIKIDEVEEVIQLLKEYK